MAAVAPALPTVIDLESGFRSVTRDCQGLVQVSKAGKQLSRSVPQFLHLWNRDKKIVAAHRLCTLIGRDGTEIIEKDI